MSKEIFDLIFSMDNSCEQNCFSIDEFSHILLKFSVSKNFEINNMLLAGLYASNNEIIKNRILLQILHNFFARNAASDYRINSLEKFLERFEVDFSKMPAFIIYLGAYYMLQGNRDVAFKYFIKAREASVGYCGFSRMYLGVNSIKENSLDWVDGYLKLPAIFDEINGHFKKNESKKGAVILFAADSNYFDKFYKYLVDNIGGDIALHFHIVNTSGQFAEFINKYSFGGNVGVTYENYRYARDRTYFATNRFYRAIELIKFYDSPVYISDIDNKFINNSNEILDSLSAFDVGLRLNKNADWFPWWGPSAGSLYINNTLLGKKFAQHMKEYIMKRFVVNGKNNWWFDQLMINEVYDYCKRRYPEMRFANLSDVKYHLSVVRGEDLSSLKMIS